MRIRFALIVIDMLVDFFERLPELSAQRERLVTSINELTDAFRRAGQPVIWVRQEFKPDLSDAFLDMRRRRIAVTIAGTEGSQILPDLHKSSADRVIIKKRYSAFYRTELDDLLATLDPETLVIAGINTHACIRTAVVDAYQRDFDITVATDCVGSYDAAHHEMTLRYLEGRMARLRSNTELIQDLASRRAE